MTEFVVYRRHGGGWFITHGSRQRHSDRSKEQLLLNIWALRGGRAEQRKALFAKQSNLHAYVYGMYAMAHPKIAPKIQLSLSALVTWDDKHT
ncbi:hypothetical protein AG1IA_09492 [Rhizoctonia solani AG-1 IA]|uniref:Uncharacterized protein n=1 Tax=Thanatephorus cucumeris (strain AG1-IA) TaxID=983506 RepID=L8WI52_THACA|nr:hypothetical protein AG1IA_09492 [Rhizoctonia solani AG-1 IA]